MSVANQKIVIIKKEKYKDNFLQIGIDEWQKAVRDEKLNYSEFCLYLYLAGNMNDFRLELSQSAFQNATGYRKTSFHDAVKGLIEKGYLVQRMNNSYEFHTTPISECKRKNWEDEGVLSCKQSKTQRESEEYEDFAQDEWYKYFEGNDIGRGKKHYDLGF